MSSVPPKPKLRQPVLTEKYVELYCHVTLEGLLIPLAYNLLLIILCAVYGFLTRKLPENFNESGYIFVSVATTTFLWTVFLPTYFTTFYSHHRVALLAFCLILNGAITLLCLHVPKLYALYYVDESRIKFAPSGVVLSSVGATGSSGSSGSSGTSGRQRTHITAIHVRSSVGPAPVPRE